MIEQVRTFNIWQTFRGEERSLTDEPTFSDLSQTHSPSLSPNNRTLALSHRLRESTLWLKTQVDEQLILLHQGNKGDVMFEPNWSPDSNQLTLSILNGNSSRMLTFDLTMKSVVPFDSDNNVKMGSGPLMVRTFIGTNKLTETGR